jgi:hypothetical protein
VTERSSEFQRSPARDAVLVLLATASAEGIPISAILALPGVGTRDGLDHLLSRMVQDGQIERPSRGRYALTSQISAPAAPQREKPDHVHRPAGGLRHPRDLAEPPGGASQRTGGRLRSSADTGGRRDNRVLGDGRLQDDTAPPLSRTGTRHGDAFHPRKASNRTAIPEPVEAGLTKEAAEILADRLGTAGEFFRDQDCFRPARAVTIDTAAIDTLCARIGCLCTKHNLCPPTALRAIVLGWLSDGIEASYSFAMIEENLSTNIYGGATGREFSRLDRLIRQTWNEQNPAARTPPAHLPRR